MLIERKRAISPPFAAQSFKMGLLPLEFSDCLIDSPYFRENLKAHEKQLDQVSWIVGVGPGMPCAAILRTFSSMCVDLERIYCFPDWAETAETGLEGGRENGWIVDNFNPFLLFLDWLGSSKFVPNLRKNDVIDASCQHTASLLLV